MVSRPPFAQAPVAPGERPNPATPVSAPGLVLDAAAIASLRELDPTGKSRLLERLMAAFESSTARLIPQLLDSHARADMTGIRHVAHTLKSSAASLGGVQVAAICADLETRVRNGQTSDLQPCVQALRDAVQRLMLALQAHTEASR